MRLVLTLMTIAALLPLCCGCGREAAQTVNVVGSTSVQPFAELLAEEFDKKQAEIAVDVQGGGSTAGLQAATNGIADIGTCSRELNPDEHFNRILIARDGLAVVVHLSNPVDNLSRQQIQDLFAGNLTNWKDLGGRDGPVRLIMREEGSGTREAFVKLVLGKTRVSRKALVQESNGSVKELVKNDPGAVGYMSLGLVGDELKAIRIGGAAPSAAAVVKGTYPLWRPFLFVTRGAPSPAAQKFIDFVLSADGQRLLESEGLVRVK